MASPWKFLARLVSPRRQREQDGGAFEAVKPDVLAKTGPTETIVEESRRRADQLTGEQSPSVDRSDAVSIAHEPSDQSSSDASGFVEHGSDEAEPGSGTVSQDLGVRAAKVKNTAKGTRAERRTRAQKVERAAVALPRASTARSASADMVSLDEEIAALRSQLESKLRLQNVQLKKMLARFER